MKSQIMILLCVFAVFFILTSCQDAINSEQNIRKDLLTKIVSADDSLSVLHANDINAGEVNQGKIIALLAQPFITNNSDKDTIFIYDIHSKTANNYFKYNYDLLMPYKILPKEEMRLSIIFPGDMSLTRSPLPYIDTLIINNNPDFYVKVQGIIN